MPRASAAAAAQTAQNILNAATELFTDNGFAAVSIDDVADRAGVTRGAIYHHYRSKPGLFTATAEHLQAKVAQTVAAEAEAAGEDPEGQLRAGCHAFLDTITSETAARVLLAEAPAVLGWTQWRQMDAENSVVHLREALESAGTPKRILEAATAQLSGAMNEAALWIAESDSPERRGAAHEALDRLIQAILPPCCDLPPVDCSLTST